MNYSRGKISITNLKHFYWFQSSFGNSISHYLIVWTIIIHDALPNSTQRCLNAKRFLKRLVMISLSPGYLTFQVSFNCLFYQLWTTILKNKAFYIEDIIEFYEHIINEIIKWKKNFFSHFRSLFTYR